MRSIPPLDEIGSTKLMERAIVPVMRLRPLPSICFLLAAATLALPSSAPAHEPRVAPARPKTPPAATTAAPANAPPAAAASPPDEAKPDEATIEVTIKSEKQGTEAASRTVSGRRELELRPRLRPADVLEAVPGLFAVQHAGGGKANQYFLRGFDADHGTDVAFFVDGVPVNMVSHGHGQGYTDFHFLIPELVVSLDGYKGPYYASLGDFATAGAVNLRLAEKFEESYAQVQVGQFGMLRGLVIASPDLGDHWRAVAAAEYYQDDGPFLNPQELQRLNLFFRATHDLSHRSKVSLTWMSYGSTWNGSGQIPARAVCGEGEPGIPAPGSFGQPCLDHFGSVDPTEGGSTQRHLGQLAFSTAWHGADLTAMAYLLRYQFALFSNFTFFRDDPVQGDQIEQNDERTLGGLDFRLRRQLEYRGAVFTTSLGTQVRVDGIDNALRHDVARERLDDRVDASIGESQIGLYVEEDARVRRWLRFVVGARVQRIDVRVDDRLEDTSTRGGATSGTRGATAFLPKFTAAVSPLPQLDLYASYGRGFHSNDARGAVLARDPATLITPATGYEVGLRATPLRDLTFTAAGFLLDLSSELVWSGDEGTTEASGGTRRYGLELGARYRMKNWLFADLDATFTRARFRTNTGNGDAVALAPTRTLTAGVAARPTFGHFTPFLAVRLKSIADRPANEDASLVAEGFTLVDANAGLRWKNLEVGVDAQNLLGARWREVQFASESRLPYEPAPVTGIHYTPGWPRTVIGRATVYWR